MSREARAPTPSAAPAKERPAGEPPGALVGSPSAALREPGAQHPLRPQAAVDITREVCPMTYVRVKLALERLEPGAVLEVLLQGDEPLKNVPESARFDGHAVLALEPLGASGVHRLLLQVHRDV